MRFLTRWRRPRCFRCGGTGLRAITPGISLACLRCGGTGKETRP